MKASHSSQPLVLVPLDGRPVCYDLPQMMADMSGVSLLCPPKSMLGGADGQIKSPANLEALTTWLESALASASGSVLALDTLVYGGLIPSRLGVESLESLRDRLVTFLEGYPTLKKVAFSSIMRIPNYNFDEEEPFYWLHHGETLYNLSAQWHQALPQLQQVVQSQSSTQEAPLDSKPFDLYTALMTWLNSASEWQEKPVQSTLERLGRGDVMDFLTRRQRNFHLNRLLVQDLAEKKLDYLVFCQDDTGSYGLNVYEAQVLKADLSALDSLKTHGHVQTGADEVACCLITRLEMEKAKQPLLIWPVFSGGAVGLQCMARFDGVSIGEVVGQQIRSVGACFAKTVEQADLILLVHTPSTLQGDHCENIQAETKPEQVKVIQDWFERSQKTGQPFALLDLAYANGADPLMTQELIENCPSLWASLYGYAAWNTPGNSSGTAISMACLRLLAERRSTFDSSLFKRLLATRLLDDWAYQSTVRKQLRALPQGQQLDSNQLQALMQPFVAQVAELLGWPSEGVSFAFPCQRTFEVAVLMPSEAVKTEVSGHV